MAMTPEEMESAIKELQEEKDRLAKQVAGQEDLLQRHKTEIGDARKEFKEALEKATTTEEKEVRQKLIDRLDKIEKNVTSSLNSQERGEGSESQPDVESKMTEEQRLVADDQFKKLSPEQRSKIASDPAEREKFLKAAIEARPYVPESLFDNGGKAEHKPENEYRKLFGLADDESSFVPGPSNGTDSGGYAGSKAPGAPPKADQTERRLPDGVIPRPPPKE